MRLIRSESGLSFHQVYVEFVGQGLVRCRALGARIAGAPAEIAADAPPARRLGGVLLAAGGVVAVGGLVGAAAEANASDDVVLGAAGAVVGFPFAVEQAAGDGDRPVLCEVLRAGFGLAAEGGDVDEQRRLVFLVVDRQAHVADAAFSPSVGGPGRR